MCGEYGIDIWRELKAIRELLESLQEKPKKKRGRPKGSKNANTKTQKK